MQALFPRKPVLTPPRWEGVQTLSQAGNIVGDSTCLTPPVRKGCRQCRHSFPGRECRHSFPGRTVLTPAQPGRGAGTLSQAGRHRVSLVPPVTVTPDPTEIGCRQLQAFKISAQTGSANPSSPGRQWVSSANSHSTGGSHLSQIFCSMHI